jgi:conjugal transfer pilus assembly protein TraW
MSVHISTTRARRLVIFQLSVSMSLIAASLLVACAAKAKSSTVGRTWAIAEPDALAEIEARAAKQPPSMAANFGARSSWSALRAAPLARTQINRTRFFVPFFTLEEEIRLPEGKLLYPRGYTFNPLDYVSLPQRLVIVEPRDLGWALSVSRPTDFILLTQGTARDDDVITLGERHNRALFILEDRVKERLGLTVAPVIVRQVDRRLELQEVHIDRPAVRGAAR